VSKFTKRIDQTLDHVREQADWNIVKMPEWVLHTKFLDQPWWTNVFRRYCVACGHNFGGGEAWSVLVNTKKLRDPEDGPTSQSVNVCSHCAPTESLLASRLAEPRTKKNILALI
jgi:hypothetical protein